MKRASVKALKVVALIAGVVAFLMPGFSITHILMFLGCIVVAAVCVVVSGEIDEEPRSVNLWPPKPK